VLTDLLSAVDQCQGCATETWSETDRGSKRTAVWLGTGEGVVFFGCEISRLQGRLTSLTSLHHVSTVWMWFGAFSLRDYKTSTNCIRFIGYRWLFYRGKQCSVNTFPHVRVWHTQRHTRWFKYDRDKLWLVYTQIVPVIFEPPSSYLCRFCILFISVCIFGITTQAMWVQRNTETRSCEHCCRGKSNKYYILLCAYMRACRVCMCVCVCVCVCVYMEVPGRVGVCMCALACILAIQYATCMRHILSFLPFLALPNFSTLSDKRHNFRKKKLLNLKGVFWFSLHFFVWNISHSKKNSATYFHKCKTFPCKVPVTFIRFYWNSNFVDIFSKKLKY
jgi:hypothetical protein